ncbi:MAG: ABC transporter permease [Woeseiaceae bacterium]
MELGPIWRAILRNKSSYALIALQIAVTMAIMVNAIAIIQERTSNMVRESGIDEDNIVTLTSISFAADIDMQIMIDEDLAMLRAMPGVRNAIATNSFPLRGGGSSRGLATEPGPDADGIGVAVYFSDEHAVDTYGTNIIDGRNFAQDEIAWNDTESSTWPSTGVITEAMAKELFPDEQGSYVGKTVYANDNDPVKIIGILDKLQAPWDGWERVENSMLVPIRLDGENVKYVVRTEPGQLNNLIPQIEEGLAKNKERIIENVMTMAEVRERSYLGDAAMIKMLSFIVILLTAITGLGIVGLASFSVSRRTRQIGVRRALGATRPEIMRYFMIENFIISSVGIVAGGVFAIALNIFMVQAFALTPLAWYVVPIAMIILWVVGQAAVAGPARRASAISPAIATRSI